MSSEIPKLEPRRAPKAAVAALIGSLLIPVACADNTVDSTTTTPPTTIETTTTVPTTTLPETTTTTSTTIPETTTTTLPADICEPTGQAKTGGINIELGYFREGYPFITDEEGLTGRIVKLYESPYEDFQGVNTSVLYVDICIGKFADGSPIIQPIMLGRPSVDILSSTFYSTPDLFTSNSTSNSYSTLESLKNELEKRAENFSQIGFVIDVTDVPPIATRYSIPDWIQICLNYYKEKGLDQKFNAIERCNMTLERDKYLPNNIEFINLLKNGTLSPSTEIKPILASSVILFKATIPNN